MINPYIGPYITGSRKADRPRSQHGGTNLRLAPCTARCSQSHACSRTATNAISLADGRTDVVCKKELVFILRQDNISQPLVRPLPRLSARNARHLSTIQHQHWHWHLTGGTQPCLQRARARTHTHVRMAAKNTDRFNSHRSTISRRVWLISPSSSSSLAMRRRIYLLYIYDHTIEWTLSPALLAKRSS